MWERTVREKNYEATEFRKHWNLEGTVDGTGTARRQISEREGWGIERNSQYLWWKPAGDTASATREIVVPPTNNHFVPPHLHPGYISISCFQKGIEVL